MGLVGLAHPGPDNLNAAPTETIVVLRLDEAGSPQLAAMRWWLTPRWAKEMTTRYSMFNAKSETLHNSPAFREPFRSRRCVVPVCGFYEWARSAGHKLPYYIHAAKAPGLLLAGIWDRWQDPQTGEGLDSFAVLTTPANAGLAFVHHRQPVLLAPHDARRWMDPQTPRTDLQPLLGSMLPMPLQVLPVSSWVNDARHKDGRCMQGVAEPVEVVDEPVGERSGDGA